MDFDFKENYNINDLLDIIEILRSENGCPWDKKQTHQSIRRNFIEETYEAIEAIDNDDRDLLLEELGDVLLQIVFHCQMEKEKDSFNFDDVCNGICHKLIIRHPHVFSDVKADTSEEVLKNWDAIKMKTKKQSSQTDVMQSVARSLPALIRAEKVQKKAADVGFDWNDASLALKKVYEESSELEEAISVNDKDNIPEELGDLIFSVVNVSRLLKIDPEECLNKATDKFIDRFNKVETFAESNNIDIKKESLDNLNNMWDNAKEL